MSCAQIDELLSDLLADELPEGVRAGVETHIACCNHCSTAYKKLKRTVRFVQAQSAPALAPGTPGGNYFEFTSALMQGEPEVALAKLLQELAIPAVSRNNGGTS
jgi:hypothetical protein